MSDREIELLPDGAPKPLNWLRRTACGVIGACMLAAAAYCLTAPNFVGIVFLMGLMLLGGGAVLIGAALLPRLTFQKLDRTRWR